jgi:hypothetical protein
MRQAILTTIAACMIFVTGASYAQACVNRYVVRTEGNNKKIFTFLTGKVTFPEAQELVKKFADKSLQPVEWVDDSGKTIARATTFEAVRPMPVACDGKPSGSVINVMFLTFAPPGKGVTIKFPDDMLVYFEEQGK